MSTRKSPPAGRSAAQSASRVAPGLWKIDPRPYNGLPELEYPFHDRTLTVTRCGRICLERRKINISQALAGQKVRVKEVSEKIWLVSFMQYDLGFFDHETCRIESAENPFAAKLSLASMGHRNT